MFIIPKEKHKYNEMIFLWYQLQFLFTEALLKET